MKVQHPGSYNEFLQLSTAAKKQVLKDIISNGDLELLRKKTTGDNENFKTNDGVIEVRVKNILAPVKNYIIINNGHKIIDTTSQKRIYLYVLNYLKMKEDN